MKYVFIAFIVLSTLVISCSEPTQEELIEKVFKEYVNKNFDDPNNLKEIISITTEDTLSATKTISFVENILDSSDSTLIRLKAINDSLNNVFTTNMNKITASKKLTSKYYGDKIALNTIEELIDYSQQEMQYFASEEFQTFKLKHSTLKNAINTLKEDSTFIVTYEIKTRILTKNKELEIKKYYAQSNQKKTIEIFENNSLDLYPKIYSQIYKDLQLYTELYKRRTDRLLKLSSILQKGTTYLKAN